MLRRRSKQRNVCQRLRLAVDAMPRHAREAMLRGIDQNTIIVGAYSSGPDGGICPMLAAHRNGGRTDLASFARSWDRYTDARGPRPATPREVRTLRALLVSSLLAEDVPSDSMASAAKRIRADRERAASLEAVPTGNAQPEGSSSASPRIEPPEPSGLRIRVRRLARRQERDARRPERVS